MKNSATATDRAISDLQNMAEHMRYTSMMLARVIRDLTSVTIDDRSRGSVVKIECFRHDLELLRWCAGAVEDASDQAYGDWEHLFRMMQADAAA